MSLLICIEDKQGSRVIRTKLGDPNQARKFNNFNARDVQEVVATDDELEQCFKILSRVPHGGDIHTFCGDSAREICFNWIT
ncbi:hypothetical protein SCRM01_251 [Synechococcus phage S-CRM01]|uniref:hypothetical protein n=1 Tax=Synechococcus phage S-CRM01 TaxID=1026955 RepID=UPI000209E44C|nr:hypothetical protein SCRM01_251 [Synechococcus phage S-CRM01]AEC53197.1 hypothetical protein SCRM01_251 [Synechococcus phage S-CRM01]